MPDSIVVSNFDVIPGCTDSTLPNVYEHDQLIKLEYNFPIIIKKIIFEIDAHAEVDLIR